MTTVRWFSADTTNLAPTWRASTVTTENCMQVGQPGAAGGEAAGFFVTLGGTTAYAKESGTQFRAAHEKIASDLAYDLGLPIPPVVLCRGPNAGQLCSISHVPFEAPYKWSQAAQAPGALAAMLPRVSSSASAMTVFDTWVDNRDRVNDGNVIASAAIGGGGATAYIDYAFSLSYGWGDNAAPPVASVVPVFPSQATVDVAIVAQTVDAIEAYSDTAIDEIVSRVPSDFLSDVRKTVIAAGLKQRRGGLRPMFRTVYGGGL